MSANRAQLAAALGGSASDPASWVWLDQVHGNDVATIRAEPSAPPRADAAVSAWPGVPLVVMVADCAPIALVANAWSDDASIGVVHAGWQGLRRGVVTAAVGAMRDLGARDVQALVGPCIGPGRYEFGAGDLATLVEQFGAGVASTTEWGTPALDLPAMVRVALERAGVTSVVESGVCTASSTEYFSYRRDGVTGRQAVVAVLDP